MAASGDQLRCLEDFYDLALDFQDAIGRFPIQNEFLPSQYLQTIDWRYERRGIRDRRILDQDGLRRRCLILSHFKKHILEAVEPFSSISLSTLKERIKNNFSYEAPITESVWERIGCISAKILKTEDDLELMTRSYAESILKYLIS